MSQPQSGKIPDLHWGKHADPSVQTQIGCVYCLAEGLEAPAESHVVYFYMGTTYCARHVKVAAGAQQ